jgi:hypothetical protein
VSMDYVDKAPFAFNGRIDAVTVRYLEWAESDRAARTACCC